MNSNYITVGGSKLYYKPKNLKGSGEIQVDKVYNDFLKLFNKYFGTKATYDIDLSKVGYELIPGFKGVYPMEDMNQLDKLNDKESYIINTGEHWVALYMNKKILVIYDSFGRKYQELFHKILSDIYPKIVDVDNDAEQEIKQETCGQRALAWLSTIQSVGIDKAMLV